MASPLGGECGWTWAPGEEELVAGHRPFKPVALAMDPMIGIMLRTLVMLVAGGVAPRDVVWRG